MTKPADLQDNMPFDTGLLGTVMASRTGRIVLQILRWAIPIVLLVFLGRRLTALGWHEIWVARPDSILFYAFLILQFFLQPFGDYLIYRNLWGPSVSGEKSSLPMSVLLRKRFLNSALFDYTGEVYFYFWAQRRLNLPHKSLVHAIKDSNLLSGGAGLAMVWLVLIALLLGGGFQIPQVAMDHRWLDVLLGTVPLIICAALVIGHRKLTVLSRAQIAQTFGIHFLRSFTVLLVEFAMWEVSGALPSAIACLQFVALRLVVTRLPLLPNKDLIFVGAGIAAAGLVKVSVTPVATVLVILAAADLILGCVVVGLPWGLEHFFLRSKRAAT
jgi:hypothetical protein